MKVTFIELLKKHEINQLWYILSKFHNLPPIRAEKVFHLYEQARAEMLGLAIEGVYKGVLMCKAIDNDTKNGVSEGLYSCLILDDGEAYGFEFMDWVEVIGCEVDGECLQKYGELIVTAELLYEMTFCGFSCASVQNRADELQERLNELVLIQDTGLPAEEFFAKREKEHEERKNSNEEKAFKDWFVQAPNEVKQRIVEKLKADFFGPKQYEKATDNDLVHLLDDMTTKSKIEYKGCDSAEELLCNLFDGVDCDALLYLLATLWKKGDRTIDG